MCSRNEIARCSRKLDFRKLVHFLFPFFFRVPHSLCVEMIAAWNEYPLESNRAIEIVCKMINRVEVLLGSFLSLHLPLSQSSITIFPVHACLFFSSSVGFSPKWVFRCDFKGIHEKFTIHLACVSGLTRWVKERIHKASTISEIHITFVVSHAQVFFLFFTFHRRTSDQ